MKYQQRQHLPFHPDSISHLIIQCYNSVQSPKSLQLWSSRRKGSADNPCNKSPSCQTSLHSFLQAMCFKQHLSNMFLSSVFLAVWVSQRMWQCLLLCIPSRREVTCWKKTHGDGLYKTLLLRWMNTQSSEAPDVPKNYYTLFFSDGNLHHTYSSFL